MDVSTAGTTIVNRAVVTVADQVDTAADNNRGDAAILPPLATVHGWKFADWNGNGIQEPGEAGLDGWTMEIRNLQGTLLGLTTTMADDPQTTTDETGLYTFALPAGTYEVTELQQPGWEQTLPGNPDFSYTVTLTHGQHLEGQDFGNHPTATVMLTATSAQTVNGQDFGNARLGSLHGFKFEDRNGNGRWDKGEPGLPDVTIQASWIDPATGLTVSRTTTTAANGEYGFQDLPVGVTYTVRELPSDVATLSIPEGGFPDGFSLVLSGCSQKLQLEFDTDGRSRPGNLVIHFRRPTRRTKWQPRPWPRCRRRERLSAW